MGALKLSSPSFNVFGGGRYLLAIKKNPHLRGSIKAVFAAMGSERDFTGQFMEARAVYVKTLAFDAGFSVRTTHTALRWLEANGYITRTRRFGVSRPTQLASVYAITSKVFNEHTEANDNVLPSADVAGGTAKFAGGTASVAEILPSLAPHADPEENTLLQENTLRNLQSVPQPSQPPAKTAPKTYERKERGKAKGEQPGQFDVKVANYLGKCILTYNPDAKIGLADLREWANTFRLMRVEDGLTEHQIGKILVGTFDSNCPFYDQDPYWRDRIQSADMLRRKWNDISSSVSKATHDTGFSAGGL